MIKQIRVENFRCFDTFEVDKFKQVNLLIGGNGSGKTSLLEALFIASNPADMGSFLFLNGARGVTAELPLFLDTFMYKRDISKQIKVACQTEDERYITTYRLDDVAPTIDSKNFLPIKGVNTVLQTCETTRLTSGETTYFENQAMTLSPSNGGFTTLWSKELTNPYPKSCRGHVGFRAVTAPNRLESGLLEFIKSLATNQEDGILTEILKKFDHTILKVSLIGNDIFYATSDTGALYPIAIAGDGFLKVLYLLLGILNSKNGAVFIDEVDNGIHISNQKKFWKLMLDFAKKFNVQVFATTHSIDCLDAVASVYQENTSEEDSLAIFRMKQHTSTPISISLAGLAGALAEGYEVR